MFAVLADFGARVAPGLLLVVGCLVLARRVDPLLRVAVLILGFVLIRDAMTPVGLWRLGADGGALWLRFVDDAVLLVLLGVVVLAATAAVLGTDRRLRGLVRWGPVGAAPVAVGVGGGVLAAAPLLAAGAGTPLEQRGGDVALAVLPALLFFALAGNLAEEVLFRGLLQGRLEQDLDPVRAAWLSGTLFAACHAFLASTVTDVGWPLLLFTLYEGLICAFLRVRYGVVSAALAHGLAIFLLSSALL